MQRGRHAWHRLLIALASALGAATAMGQDLEIIDLQYRRAEDVIPVVRPLLDPDGALSGVDDKLLVRTTPANLAQIRQAVAAVDRPQRQLLITVGQGTVTGIDAASARGAATIGGGDVQVGVNRPPAGQTGAQVVVRGGTQQANLRNQSSIRTLEGSETWIAMGQSVPLTTTQAAPGWDRPVQTTTTYRDVSTGFYATARVSGDLVTLEISPRQQQYQPSRDGGTVQTRGSNTVVTGRLGEWIELGAVRETSSGNSSGLLVWGRHTGSSEYSAWVRVEEIRRGD